MVSERKVSWYIKVEKGEYMIDFSNLPETKKGYNGANGNKKCIIYNGIRYMVKFPQDAQLNENMSYANSCFSEYIGCHIFNLIGIKAQETILGTYTINGKQKIVVACKDFAVDGKQLMDFAALKNQVIDSKNRGYGTELTKILECIDKQTSFDPVQLKRYFWDMFIVDALIGNWNRHNGNWGFLYNEASDTLEFSPIYDCASSLYPQADDNIIKAVLNDSNEMDFRIKEIPFSAIKIDNKNIRYQNFIFSMKEDGCNEAIKRIVPRIEMNKIKDIVSSTPYISDLQKEFYKTMLQERYNQILLPVFNKLNKSIKKENEHQKKKHASGWSW